ncbi:MAG: hypothetical protein PHU25_00715 [Deltaproteobacteria bacterium]|nr:hypothetical protein [Deltaproteobacteria bacterium]
MSSDIRAADLWPIIQKLTHDEQVRLARLALGAASLGGDSDVAAYRTAPPSAEEFRCDEDALAWEGEGWEDVDAQG